MHGLTLPANHVRLRSSKVAFGPIPLEVFPSVEAFFPFGFRSQGFFASKTISWALGYNAGKNKSKIGGGKPELLVGLLRATSNSDMHVSRLIWMYRSIGL